MSRVQVADEGAHQPRLADAGRKRETHRQEVALEVGDRRELASHCGEGGDHIGTLFRRHEIGDAV